MDKTTLPKLRVSREEADREIQTQIEKGQQLCNQHIFSVNDWQKTRTESKKWSEKNTILLSQLFDSTLIAENDYIDLRDDYPIELIANRRSLSGRLDIFRGSMNSSINSLEEIRDRLELYDEPPETPQRTSDNEENSGTSPPIFGNDVFVVHGRDEATKHAVARFVEGLSLRAIILDEQPDAGLTIIEKLEREAGNVGFAIALLTPDDVGALKDEAEEQLKPRARQNVILELGYFMGKLGRKKVCLLIKGELENPSDLDGILYASMDNPNEWQLKLAREMHRAKLPIDPQKLL